MTEKTGPGLAGSIPVFIFALAGTIDGLIPGSVIAQAIAPLQGGPFPGIILILISSAAVASLLAAWASNVIARTSTAMLLIVLGLTEAVGLLGGALISMFWRQTRALPAPAPELTGISVFVVVGLAAGLGATRLRRSSPRRDTSVVLIGWIGLIGLTLLAAVIVVTIVAFASVLSSL